MTLDQAVALSLLGDLVAKPGLTSRLLHDDPELLERANLHLDVAKDVRQRAQTQGIHVLPWNDAGFPVLLRAISDVPPALWYRGDLMAFDAPAVAIVGSRAATAVSLETAARLGADLASRGITVVSGLARGVDSAAHRGALEHGRTIAVLGCGVDKPYPTEHRQLADRIAEMGLVLGEYPPGTPPLPHHFPLRNRLISGLSLAVVVIEASEKSGSLITAGCALEQGRDVMAVPGNVLSGRNRGGHKLLKDGAKIVECVDDIVEELGCGLVPRDRAGNGSSGCTTRRSDDPVLRVMDAGHAYDLGTLVASSGLDIARLLPRLVELEVTGAVRRAAGGRFIRAS